MQTFSLEIFQYFFRGKDPFNIQDLLIISNIALFINTLDFGTLYHPYSAICCDIFVTKTSTGNRWKDTRIRGHNAGLYSIQRPNLSRASHHNSFKISAFTSHKGPVMNFNLHSLYTEYNILYKWTWRRRIGNAWIQIGITPVTITYVRFMVSFETRLISWTDCGSRSLAAKVSVQLSWQ